MNRHEAYSMFFLFSGPAGTYIWPIMGPALMRQRTYLSLYFILNYRVSRLWFV